LSDCVNAAVERVQAFALKAVVDRALAHAKGDQLRPGNDTVLSLCEGGDLQVILTTLTFAPYYVVKVRVVAHARQDGASRVTAG
jgi:hypothetical protein